MSLFESQQVGSHIEGCNGAELSVTAAARHHEGVVQLRLQELRIGDKTDLRLSLPLPHPPVDCMDESGQHANERLLLLPFLELPLNLSRDPSQGFFHCLQVSVPDPDG